MNLKRTLRGMLVSAVGSACITNALAAGAGTSANAGSSWNSSNGTAGATAEYQGDHGWTRTDARSGRVNTATGVAVGADSDGISLSVSNALAPRNGPALASNFNLSIGRDGQVSSSFGLSAAGGPLYREASAGGGTATRRHGGGAVSEAGGRSDDFGSVTTRTGANEVRGRDLRPNEQRRGSSAVRFVHRGLRR